VTSRCAVVRGPLGSERRGCSGEGRGLESLLVREFDPFNLFSFVEARFIFWLFIHDSFRLARLKGLRLTRRILPAGSGKGRRTCPRSSLLQHPREPRPPRKAKFNFYTK